MRSAWLHLFLSVPACLIAAAACGSSADVSTDSDLGTGSMAGSDGTGATNQGTGGLDFGQGGGTGGDVECTAGAPGCEEEPPAPDPSCGDGRINVDGEECDDENGDSGDGCGDVRSRGRLRVSDPR